MAHQEKLLEVHSRCSLGVAITAAVTGIPAAQAQDNDAAMLEEVIVTATKRAQNLQDLALSITALSGQKIALQRLDNFEDYVAQIPGLSVSNRQPGANSVIMRGCAAQGLSFSDTATTSVYLDEQPITAAGYNPDPRLVDVARVEALGGPQGTLFGDAAQCGTLRIITNKPDATKQDGWVDLTASTVTDGGSGYDVSAMVNIPLVADKVALRLVGFYADEPGWVDNVLSPTPGQTEDNSAFVKSDVNSSVWSGARAGLRFNASDNWVIDLAGIYQSYELDGFGDISLNQQQFEDTSVFPVFGDRSQARFNDETWDDEWYQIALTIEGNLDYGNLLFTTAYYDRESSYLADGTAYLQAFQQLGDYFRSFNTGDPYYDTGGIYDFGGDPIATNFDDRKAKNWSFETRYATPTDGKWSAIVGAFYNKREVDEFYASNVRDLTGTDAFYYINYAGYYFYGVPLKSESNNFFSGFYESDLEQWAVFGEVSVNLTENFSITAGGRFYNIENDYIVTNAALVGLNGGKPNCDIDYCYAPGDLGKSDEDGFVPKVTFTYNWDNALMYATYSEGFRRGGANSSRPGSVFGPPDSMFPPPAGTLNQYTSDTVTNYEIGAKTETEDGRVRFNFSLYHMVWDDMQIQAEDPQDAFFAVGIVNFPEAEIDGAEVWLSWLASNNFQLEATVGYNDGELSKADTLFPGTGAAITVPVGTPLPIVPDWKANVNATYTWSKDLWGGKPYLLARYNYTGDSVNSLAGIETSVFSAPVRTQESWQTFDLQFGVQTQDWDISLFVDNLTDEKAQLFYNNRFVQQRLSINKPRTFGINFRYLFGD